MKILLTGGTGFVGTALGKRLEGLGHELSIITRNPKSVKLAYKAKIFSWSELKEALGGIEAVFNLAGQGVADRRWSKAQKERIYTSRVDLTRKLMDAISSVQNVRTLISASAIGVYGTPEGELDENSPRGEGFLAEVCSDWEKESLGRDLPGVRQIVVRIGLVLGKGGGALSKMLPAFKLGIAGQLGSGKQWMSWIHLEDLVSLMIFLLENEKAQGPYNGVAPHPVDNREFTHVVAEVLGKRVFLGAPAFALKLALGEMSEILLKGAKVLPMRVRKLGFQFRYPEFKGAAGDLLT